MFGTLVYSGEGMYMQYEAVIESDDTTYCIFFHYDGSVGIVIV